MPGGMEKTWSNIESNTVNKYIEESQGIQCITVGQVRRGGKDI